MVSEDSTLSKSVGIAPKSGNSVVLKGDLKAALANESRERYIWSTYGLAGKGLYEDLHDCGCVAVSSCGLCVVCVWLRVRGRCGCGVDGESVWRKRRR